MKLPDSRASHWLLTVASGALSVLCFAPFRQFWLMPLLLALLFSLALAQPRARQAATRYTPPTGAQPASGPSGIWL